MGDQIREIINQEVRPTSSSLAQRVEKALSFQPEAPSSKVVRLGLPERFNLANALAPGVTFGISLMLCQSNQRTEFGWRRFDLPDP